MQLNTLKQRVEKILQQSNQGPQDIYICEKDFATGKIHEAKRLEKEFEFNGQVFRIWQV